MAGATLARGGSGWRGLRAAACIVVLSSPVLAEAPKSTPAGTTVQLGMEPVHQRVMDAAWQAGAQFAEAYRRSPVLGMGLALAGAVPLLAGLFAIGRAMRRRAARRERDAPSAPEPSPIADKAWINIGEGSDAVPVAFTGEILRIGRHSDNDIALAHESVHRHHVLIQRTPDEEFVLMDLTAGTGNQPLVNGRPASRAMLSDGDRIALGDVILTFHLGVEVPAASRQPDARTPTTPSAREMTDDERDAGDGLAGRPADGIQTRRIGPSERVAARGTHRGRT